MMERMPEKQRALTRGKGLRKEEIRKRREKAERSRKHRKGKSKMKIEQLDIDFTVCKVKDFTMVNLEDEFCFIGKTDREKSVVCRTEYVPEHVLEREDGWKGFRIQGVLDFSLVGILSKIAGLLAEHGISIFALSTYDTDYVLTKREYFGKAMEVLSEAGYEIVQQEE